MMQRILIIDDDDQFRQMLTIALRKAGYEVDAACNGGDGLDLLKTFKPDLAITDIVMPEMDGIEMLIEMRRQFPNLKVVTVSGGGRLLGADVCLEIAKKFSIRTFAKPLVLAEFLAAVQELLLQEADSA